MNTREAELLQTLAELADFLDRYGETRWAAHFRQCRDDLDYLIQERAPRSKRASVAARIRSAYGGMGSFNDLVICPQNGHPVRESDGHAVNQTLQELASQVYDLSWLYQRCDGADL